MSSHAWRRLHKWLTIVWLVWAVPSMIIWGESVRYVNFLSLYAVVISHWALFWSARVEDKMEIEEGGEDSE